VLSLVFVLGDNYKQEAEATANGVWRWGLNANGQLGDATNTSRNSVTRATPYGQFSGWFYIVSAGDVHGAGIDASGRLFTWGGNASGQLGDGTTTNRNVPVHIMPGTYFSHVAAGERHTLAIDRNGRIWAWGANNRGQLGDGTTTNRHSPVQLSVTQAGSSSQLRFVYVAASTHDDHSMAICSSGNIFQWGRFNFNQLNDVPTRIFPQHFHSSFLSFKTVSTNSGRAFAIANDGRLFAWGANSNGGLGDGTTTNRTQAVRVGGDLRFKKVSTGVHSTLAITTDGRLFGWGLNMLGEIGDGTMIIRRSPIAVRADLRFKAVSVAMHTLAVERNGRLWAWGRNGEGQIGDGTNTGRTSPVLINAVTRASRVSAGNNFSLAIYHPFFAQPNVSVSGNRITWGNGASGASSFTDATNFEIFRNGTRIGTVAGNVRSFDLPAVNYWMVGMHTIQVAPIISSQNNMQGSRGNVSWLATAPLLAPQGVEIQGEYLIWNIPDTLCGFCGSENITVFCCCCYYCADCETTCCCVRNSQSPNVANTTHFRILAGNTLITTVPITMGQREWFNLASWLSLNDPNATLVEAGAHSINVVAMNMTASSGWLLSPQAYVGQFVRAGRVDSISITAQGQGAANSTSLGVGWPRPLSVEQMPSIQLLANVIGINGTDKSVTWSSSNPSIATVDAVSGFVRATWPENMWTQSQLPHLATIITARSVYDNSVMGQFTIQIIFADPPYPLAVGVAILGGLRHIELPVDGSALINATQFSASAFGYNLGANTGVTWSSSDAGVATVNRYTGVLNALRAGVVRITATSVASPNVPYGFYVTILRDATAIATNVTIFCDMQRTDERRIVIPYNAVEMPFVDLRAFIEGHNIGCQLVTWTSSCGAQIGLPSLFLSLSHTADGVRVTGLSQAGPLILTATPVNAVGVVGRFRIFVDRAVEPSVTSISVSAPSVSTLVIPIRRPISSTELPSVQLTATTIGGIGGGTNSPVVWTSSCGAVAGFGLDRVVGQFVEFILHSVNPNIVTVRAVAGGLTKMLEQVTITATSQVTPSMYASRILTVEQPVISEIVLSKVFEAHSGVLTIPYGNTEVGARAGLDLRAVVGTSNASVQAQIMWVSQPAGAVMFDNVRLEGQNVVVTVRPGFVGVVTIRAKGAYCGTQSNEIVIEIVQESVTSVRVLGPLDGMFEYAMLINLPRPDAVQLPVVQLGASVGGSFAAANNLVWTSSCGGSVVEFLGGTSGGLVMLRARDAGVAVITAMHQSTGFYGSFTIVVEQSALYSVEILGDGVVREQIAMLIPLVYADGVYSLPELAQRQMLTLSLQAALRGNVASQFVWTVSSDSVVRINGATESGEGGFSKITDLGGFITLLPYGTGRAVIRAVSMLDPSVYAEFIIYVTRGTASCNIQDGILDLPTIAEGDIRVILVCEHYFGAARMSHTDMSLEYAHSFELPTLQINIAGAIFFGWSLSRGGDILESLPVYLLDTQYGADTILLFAVWYIPYAENGSGSNLARNIIIGTLSVAGVGAAGTAGYIAQSKIRARRKSEADEWGMD